MLTTQIIVMVLYAVITEFTHSWLNEILPAFVIVNFILLIPECILAYKCVKRENEEWENMYGRKQK